MEKPILLYDADCGFCQWSVNQLKRRDPQNEFTYLPSIDFPGISQELVEQSQREIVLFYKGCQLNGADAALKLYCHLKPWSPLQIFKLPPFIWIARVIYRIIANNRQTISRWLKLPSSCQIPSRK